MRLAKSIFALLLVTAAASFSAGAVGPACSPGAACFSDTLDYPIVFGDVVAGEIHPIAESDLYAFTGTVNDIVEIGLQGFRFFSSSSTTCGTGGSFGFGGSTATPANIHRLNLAHVYSLSLENAKLAAADGFSAEMLARGPPDSGRNHDPPPIPPALVSRVSEDCAFVSHSSKNRGFIDRLLAYLRDRGIAYFCAPESIPAGSNFYAAIHASIAAPNTIVVPVISARSLDSWDFETEMALAFQQAREGKLHGIVAVVIDDCCLNRPSAELPHWAAILRAKDQIIDLTGWEDAAQFEAGMATLVDSLKGNFALLRQKRAA